MKNIKINFFAILLAVLSIAVFAPVFGITLTLLGVGITLVVIQFVKVPKGALNSEVIRKIFTADLQKNLYPDGTFYKMAKRDTGVPISASTVEIPQAGARPNVVKNPTELPLKARLRKDDKKYYEVDLYATEVDVVTQINQDWTSYDKRAAILEDHVNTLNQRIADETQVLWAPTLVTNIVRTTGANNTGTKVTGMTGNRKEITYQDIVDVCTKLDLMEVPDDGRRCILIYTEQIGEIKKIGEFRDYDKTGIVGQLASGSIGRLQNMNVFKRSVPLLYNNSLVKKGYGTAIAATDNIAILAWHPDFVRVAEGAAEVYIEYKKPGYQGDIMNAAVRGGATISRTDEKGVVVLVQG